MYNRFLIFGWGCNIKVDSENLAYLDLAIINLAGKLIKENNLIVGLVHWDTLNNQVLTIEERNTLIENALNCLLIKQKNRHYFLVAPEYFYSRLLTDQGNEVNSLCDMIKYIPNEQMQQFYKTNRRYYPGSFRQIE